jgi:NDP-hexose-3-ketoreductase
MHLLILGYSSIVRRRVLPAARAVAAFDRISIASRSHGAGSGEVDAKWYADYRDALESSRPDVVYVSGMNSAHAEWITASLERGYHVVADKPALPDLPTTEAMLALAARQRVGLAEATVFTFHPQVAALKELIAGAAAASTRVTAVFSVPPLPRDNFRYRADRGGGSLSDLGPYAVAVNRIVFGASPGTASCRVLTCEGSPAVDTSFSVMMTHDSGGAVAGHFGFGTAYQNRLSVLTASCAIDIDRIFTTDATTPAGLRVRDASGERVVAVPAADAFAEFLGAFARAADRHDFEAFQSAMRADAALLQRLRQAAQN